MAYKYAHLRAKAIQLRTEKQMTLDEIIECLKLPKTTIYHWIKDLPIPQTEKQSAARLRASHKNRDNAAVLRQQAYQRGWDEAPELLNDLTFRDFVVLYMAEGTKRNRNVVAFVNSDTRMVVLAHRWIKLLTQNKMDYHLQCHADHDEDELKAYWANLVGIEPSNIKTIRKSNSGQLSGRNFRSQYGLLTVRVGDTYLRARLEAWMDFIKQQW